jgi:hypothetical protein
MRPWVKWVLFGNSYTPFFLILLVRDFKKAYPYFGTPWLSWTLVGLVVVSNVTLWWVLGLRGKSSAEMAGTITKISSKTGESLNYIVTYIIPFLSFKVAEDLIPLIILMAVIGVLYVNSNLLYVNPMLSVFKYKVYEVTLKEEGTEQARIVLTRRRHAEGEPIRLVLLTGDPTADALYQEVSS